MDHDLKLIEYEALLSELLEARQACYVAPRDADAKTAMDDACLRLTNWLEVELLDKTLALRFQRAFLDSVAATSALESLTKLSAPSHPLEEAAALDRAALESFEAVLRDVLTALGPEEAA